jgi:hypothetical protein
MEGFVKPNQVYNKAKIKQKFEIFVVVSGYDKKTNKEKCCMLLNLAGEQVIDV